MKFAYFSRFGAPEGTDQHKTIVETAQQMVLAEQLGFDAVWMAEHHFSSDGLLGDPYTVASWVASRTKRVRLGIGVSVLPFVDPLRVAEQVALLDVLSEGRVDFGIGRGYQVKEFAVFDIPMEQNRAIFDERLEIILEAWTSDKFSYQGRYHSYTDASVLPKPVQQPHPPIFVATSGNEETVIATAKRGYPMLEGGVFMGSASVREKHGLYEQTRRTLGHEASDIALALANSPQLGRTFVAETTEKAKTSMEKSVMWFHHTLIKASFPPHLHSLTSDEFKRFKDRISDREQLTFEDLWDRDIIGDPARCIDKLEEMREAGVEYILCWFNPGGVDDLKVRESMQLFSEKVMPHFQ